MKTRHLALKLMGAPPPAAPPSVVATATGPVFQLLDPPGVDDAHGDTMDAGALRLPAAPVAEVPLYFLHSYHVDVVPDARPDQRVAIGVATVWEEGGMAYMAPRFFGNTDLAVETERGLEAGDISACSVGYLTIRATPNGRGPSGKGEDVHEARLIEVSLCDRGAKSGAVRIKAMDEQQQNPEEKKQEDTPERPPVDMHDLYAKVAAIHAKLFPPEPDEEKPEPSAEEPDDVAQTKTADPIAEWWRSHRGGAGP